MSLNSHNENTLNSHNENTLNSHNETTLNSHNETTLNSHNNNIFNHMEYPSRERRIASDADGLEADAIIHLNDGRWGAIEVKLGSHGIDAGARNLIRLAHKVDTENMGAPSFLAVVTPPSSPTLGKMVYM